MESIRIIPQDIEDRINEMIDRPIGITCNLWVNDKFEKLIDFQKTLYL